jgi:DNA-binding response OmpR family regulator
MVRVKELLRRSVVEPVQELEKITSIGKYTFMPQKQELWFKGELSCRMSHRENELLTLSFKSKTRFWSVRRY